MKPMRRPFLMGAITALGVAAIFGVLVGAIVTWSGVIDVSATNAGGLADKVLGFASTQSIRHHAPRENNPHSKDPAALKTGLAHYRDMCVACHGGPGAEPAEFAAGLHPSAPDLAAPDIQAFTDGMLYQTISGGIGSTGMPAFSSSHKPDEIWSIVAFVRHLPSLTAEEKQALGGGRAKEEEKAAPAPQPAGGKVHAVAMSGFGFNPRTIEVAAGDAVEWTNKDFVAHTATADDKSFDTGRLDPGQSKRVVIGKQGTIGYFCRYHSGMKGTVVAR